MNAKEYNETLSKFEALEILELARIEIKNNENQERCSQYLRAQDVRRLCVA